MGTRFDEYIGDPAEQAKIEASLCYDCRQDPDNCPDCCDCSLYLSPDHYETKGG